MKKLISRFRFLSFLFNIKSQQHIYQWLVKRTKPYLPSLVLMMFFSILTTGLSIAMTLTTKYILDTATANGQLLSGVIIYLLVFVVSTILTTITGIITAVITEKFSFGIRLKIYNSVMNTLWDRITKFHSGDIITRLSSDVDIVASGIAEIIPSIFSLGITFLGAFITLAFFDPVVAVIALVFGPITALVGIISARKLRPIQKKIQESESAYKSYMQESIANLTVYKAFNAQDKASDSISELRKTRVDWVMKRQRISAISAAAMSASFQAGYIAAFSYSALQLSIGAITYGTMSIFLTLVNQIQAPVVGLSRVVPRVVSIFTSAARIMQIDDMPNESYSEQSFKGDKVGIKVEDLTFAYGEEEIIKDAELTVKPGEFVAMMGSSGIGKTTFIRLIMSFLKPANGSIKLYDESGNSSIIDAGSREHISYVPQGNTLISGSIIDNIRLGNSDISEEEIWSILKIVAVDEFVKSTPDGLYTVIGERGLGLSEGQAQRLAISRALAKKAPVLILDEATSALDEATEIAVLDHLRNHSIGRTCLLITHRRSTLEFCDRCIRIDNKKIIEDVI